MTTPQRIVIIGAGVGGLATAARLAHLGHQVTIFEQTNQIGGRNRHEQVNNCTFDGGPTLMMMLDPFRKLFADLGERMEDHLDITLCDPSYRVFFRGYDTIDGTPNVARMLAQIESQISAEEAAKYPKFLGDLAELYHTSIPNFVRTNYTNPFDIISPVQLARVIKHNMLGNLAKRVNRTFRDERLRMLFSFQTMYLGLSPYDAPWVYGTLTYMEYGEGIWYPNGGLPAISDAIAKLATERGAKIHLNFPVRKINTHSIELMSGETIPADIIISNADLPTTEEKLLAKPRKTKFRNSCSAYCLYIDYAGELPELLHHNVIFGKDYKGNFDSLFNAKELPSDPAFYAAISSKTEPSRAPFGNSNLFILIPVPHLEHPWSESDEKILQEKVFARLAEISSFDRSKVRAMKQRTPRDWQSELGLHQGAAFGISHDLFQSAFFRPKNQSKTQKNLYYVGASTAPGNGLPMVLISAELLERRLKLASIAQDKSLTFASDRNKSESNFLPKDWAGQGGVDVNKKLELNEHPTTEVKT